MLFSFNFKCKVGISLILSSLHFVLCLIFHKRVKNMDKYPPELSVMGHRNVFPSVPIK